MGWKIYPLGSRKEGVQNMKEFEKWYEENNAGFHGKFSCREAWREALEWFWKTAEHLSPSDYEILEKELGDETSQTGIQKVQGEIAESSS